ncbi:MAG TPA: hypothetical protein VLK58_23640 [Conexibacter sp.]|nr:hypothetical protein [Conexibacter sp.]
MPSPRTTRITLLAALALALLCGGCGASGLKLHPPQAAGASERSVVAYDCNGVAQVAPLSLSIACRRETRHAFRLRWRGWGTPTATATSLMGCNCGPSGRVRVRIRLSNIVLDDDGGPPYYKRADVTLLGKPGTGRLPAGEPRTRRYWVFDGLLIEDRRR